jgi:hypothetical protein
MNVICFKCSYVLLLRNLRIYQEFQAMTLNFTEIFIFYHHHNLGCLCPANFERKGIYFLPHGKLNLRLGLHNFVKQ